MCVEGVYMVCMCVCGGWRCMCVCLFYASVCVCVCKMIITEGGMINLREKGAAGRIREVERQNRCKHSTHI